MVGGEVVEICGAAGAGKTGLCLRMAAVQAAAGRHVLYLDTGAAVTPKAIVRHIEDTGAQVGKVEGGFRMGAAGLERVGGGAVSRYNGGWQRLGYLSQGLCQERICQVISGQVRFGSDVLSPPFMTTLFALLEVRFD